MLENQFQVPEYNAGELPLSSDHPEFFSVPPSTEISEPSASDFFINSYDVTPAQNSWPSAVPHQTAELPSSPESIGDSPLSDPSSLSSPHYSSIPSADAETPAFQNVCIVATEKVGEGVSGYVIYRIKAKVSVIPTLSLLVFLLFF